jgi:hypothetical protein
MRLMKLSAIKLICWKEKRFIFQHSKLLKFIFNSNGLKSCSLPFFVTFVPVNCQQDRDYIKAKPFYCTRALGGCLKFRFEVLWESSIPILGLENCFPKIHDPLRPWHYLWTTPKLTRKGVTNLEWSTWGLLCERECLLAGWVCNGG